MAVLGGIWMLGTFVYGVYWLATWKRRRKARQLLFSFMDERQRKQYRWRRSFDVIGSEGRRYRIKCIRRSGSVVEFNGGVKSRGWCAVTSWRYPLPDQQLALKLLIEKDEPGFRGRALSWPWY